MPLAAEEIKIIQTAHDHAEITKCSGGVNELSLRGQRRVYASEVDKEAVVDEDVDVIVASDLKLFITVVEELRA